MGLNGEHPLVRALSICKRYNMLGSGCGTVCCAVASDTRDPQFAPQHWQKFICQLYNIEKTKNKEKEAGIGPLKKDTISWALNTILDTFKVNFIKWYHES